MLNRNRSLFAARPANAQLRAGCQSAGESVTEPAAGGHRRARSQPAAVSSRVWRCVLALLVGSLVGVSTGCGSSAPPQAIDLSGAGDSGSGVGTRAPQVAVAPVTTSTAGSKPAATGNATEANRANSQPATKSKGQPNDSAAEVSDPATESDPDDSGTQRIAAGKGLRTGNKSTEMAATDPGAKAPDRGNSPVDDATAEGTPKSRRAKKSTSGMGERPGAADDNPSPPPRPRRLRPGALPGEGLMPEPEEETGRGQNRDRAMASRDPNRRPGAGQLPTEDDSSPLEEPEVDGDHAVDYLAKLKKLKKLPIVRGGWKFFEDELFSSNLGVATLALPGSAPRDYEFLVDAEVMEGQDGPGLGLVVDGHQVVLAFDSWGQQVSGLHFLDGRPGNNNLSTQKTPAMERGVNRFRVVVKHHTIHAYCNGTLVLDWTGDPKRLALDTRLGKPPGDKQLFLLTSQASVRFDRIQMAPLKGDAAADDSETESEESKSSGKARN